MGVDLKELYAVKLISNSVLTSLSNSACPKAENDNTLNKIAELSASLPFSLRTRLMKQVNVFFILSCLYFLLHLESLVAKQIQISLKDILLFFFAHAVRHIRGSP